MPPPPPKEPTPPDAAPPQEPTPPEAAAEDPEPVVNPVTANPHTMDDIADMLEHPELYDDPQHHVAVFFGEEWPEIPEDPTSQENLMKDAAEARNRHAAAQTEATSTVPADMWSTPYVEQVVNPGEDSPTESRRKMAQFMENDHIPCQNCGSRFPTNAMTRCGACDRQYCDACLEDGQLCRSCKPSYCLLG